MKNNLLVKIISLSILLLSSGNILSQTTLKVILNPDNGKGIIGAFAIFDNKLFYTYKMRSDSICVVYYNGIESKIIQIPNGYKSIATAFPESDINEKVFRNKLILTLQYPSLNQYNLAEFNGESLKLIPNPENTNSSPLTIAASYNKKLDGKIYFSYSNGIIAEYDGQEIKLLPSFNGYGVIPYSIYQNKLFALTQTNNNRRGLAFLDKGNWEEIDLSKYPQGYGAGGQKIENNNKLYFPFYGTPNLGELNGKSFRIFPHPIIGLGIDATGDFFKLKNNIYFNYKTIYYKENQPIHQLGTLISDTIKLIKNPDDGEGVSAISYYNRGTFRPMLFKENIYLKYFDNKGLSRLAKFDGTNLTSIDNPINTNGFADAYRPIVYQNSLFLVFKTSNSKHSLYKYDGVEYTQISIPENGEIPWDFQAVVYQNKLYFTYLNPSGQTTLMEYSETNPLTATSITFNKNSICDGDSILLKSNKTGDCIWYLNDQEIEGESKNFIYAKEGGYYSVAYRNANLDVSPKSTPIKITVNYNNSIPSISTKDSLNVCSGTKITLKSSLKSGIQWYKDNSPITATTDSTIITSSPGTYLAKTLSNGCYSESSNSLIVKIKSEPPKPIFNTTNFSFCQGDTLKLSITNVNKKDTLRWFFNNKVDSSNTSTKNFIDTAKVYVTRKDSASCTITSDTITLLKKELPKSPTLSRDSENNLVSNYSIGNKWFKDGARIADTTQKIKPTTNGLYSATSTQNGCTSLISQGYYYLTNSVSNLSNNEFLNISPNPTEGYLYFNFKIENLSEIFIDIIDANGRVVFSRQRINDGQKLDISSLPNGNYFLYCRNNRGKLLKLANIVKR